MKRKIKTAIFPVGGLGTRFLPATKVMPKEMLPVVDKPLIQYAFEEAKAAGIEKFIFITGRNKNVISNHFDHAYELQKTLGEKEKKELLSLTKDWIPAAGQIAFVRQQQPLGLGHAVWCARNFICGEPFAVLLADEMLLTPKPFLKEMIEAYENSGDNIIGVDDIARKDVGDYGIIDPASDDGKMVKIKDMVEKPEVEKAPSNIAIIGRYILNPEIITHLENGKPGAGGEIQLTDAMRGLLKKQDFSGIRFSGRRFDCGNKVGFLEANIAFALENKDMRKSVLKMLKDYTA